MEYAVIDQPAVDYAPGLERAFSFEPKEQSYRVEEIEGQIPAYVRGGYYLNGPARFEFGGLQYRHWLDGDGMICSLQFEPYGVAFTNRFVRSRKFLLEKEADRPLFRTFGTAFDGDLLKRRIMIESPINVSVYPYHDSLLAFGEQGLPCELDPLTLEARGEFNFGGALNDVSPFAAHPKFDRETGELFNFGIAYSATEPLLNVYRFDGRGRLMYRKRLRLDYSCSLHDFGLSKNYAVFYLSPYVLNMQSLVLEERTLMDSLKWEPERGSRLLIVARETGAAVASIPVGSRHCLHFINCFDAGKELTVDVIELDQPIYDQYQTVPDLFADVCEGRPVRYVVDMADHLVCEKHELDYRRAPDFPSVEMQQASRCYQDFWMLGISETGKSGRKFFDELIHASWDTTRPRDIYQAPPLNYLCGEPIHIADPSRSTAGAVICQMFDARTIESSFVIFDADSVARGPVARLWLNAPVQLGFHSSFAAAVG